MFMEIQCIDQMRERKRDRERQRETDRDRERQRETGRETERDRERQREAERDRESCWEVLATNLNAIDGFIVIGRAIKDWATCLMKKFSPQNN